MYCFWINVKSLLLLLVLFRLLYKTLPPLTHIKKNIFIYVLGVQVGGRPVVSPDIRVKHNHSASSAIDVKEYFEDDTTEDKFFKVNHHFVVVVTLQL